jgi:hypothetical protein
MQLRLKNGLTPKQEAFARLVADGKSSAEAYRTAYDTNGNQATVDAEGAGLMRHPLIAPRIEALRERAARYADINSESLADELEDARTTAKGAEVPQAAAMIKATERKANLVGLLMPQMQVTSRSVSIDASLDGMSVDELRQLMALGSTARALETGDGTHSSE